MTFIFALTVAVLFGTGAYLMLKPDLIRVVVGMIVIANAASLTLMAAGMTRGRAPIRPQPRDAAVSDPLVQAMTLTAIVIGFGVIALLLALVYRVYASHDTVDLDDLARSEAERSEADEQEQAAP